MGDIWKDNWEETKQHFVDWWQRKGIVMTTSLWMNQYPREEPWADVPDPGQASSMEMYYTDVDWRVKHYRYELSRSEFVLDTIPRAGAELGPGSLGLFLGAEPDFTKETVWYKPCIDDPENHPPLKFDPENRWWKLSIEMTRKLVEASGGNFIVGLPDLIENIDTVAALRDTQKLMFDLVERPAWVKKKIEESDAAWFKAYDGLYEIAKMPDGSSCFEPFMLWGPGKVAKLQSDACAMISPEMFDEFVVPSLTKQCEWLDHSMYHLDGTQAVVHLDALLKIEALDAIEWTPQAGKPTGSDPVWWDMYKKILDGGKSIQVVGAMKSQVPEMIKKLGTKGFYIEMGDLADVKEAEEFRKSIK